LLALFAGVWFLTERVKVAAIAVASIAAVFGALFFGTKLGLAILYRRRAALQTYVRFIVSFLHRGGFIATTVYFGGNVLFASSDKGYNWKELSGDLTTNDKSKQTSSGGEIYQDNTAAEFHCTIITIAESPKEKGVIWCGTDDGNVQITRDGGKTWTNVNKNITGLPAFSWIGKIHASEHNGGTALVIADNHRSDDFKPYVFLTTDYGKTWSKITTGLQQDDYVKVVYR
jgi:hypothetical protein